MSEAAATLIMEAHLKDFVSANMESMKKNMAAAIEKMNSATKEHSKEVSELSNIYKTFSNNLASLPSELVKTAGGAVAGAVAFGALAGTFHKAYEAGEKYLRANLELNAILDSTGRSAEFLSGELNALASSLASATRNSSASVKSAEAMLVTFDRIGTEVFPRVLKDSADLAAFFGSDLSTASRQLGLALQQPETATRLLREANIKLTDSEKNKIKAWVDGGEQTKAQTFILEKLEAKIGGFAAQTTTAGDLVGKGMAGIMRTAGLSFVGLYEDFSETVIRMSGRMTDEMERNFEKQRNATRTQQDKLREIEELRTFVKNNPAALAAKEKLDLIDKNAKLMKQVEREVTRAEEDELAKRGLARNKDFSQKMVDQRAAIETASRLTQEEAQAKTDAAAKAKQEREKIAEEDRKFDEQVYHNRLQHEADFQNKLRKLAIKEKNEDITADEKKTEAVYKRREQAEKEKQKTDLASAQGSPFKVMQLQLAAELKAVEGNEAAKFQIQKRFDSARKELLVNQSIHSVQTIGANLQTVAHQYKSFAPQVKAFAQFQNALDTYASATAAYKSASDIPYVGWLMGPVAAASAVAAGLANAARIDSMSFERGGEVIGPRHSSGGVSAELEGGEFVLSRKDVQNLGGASGVERLRSHGAGGDINAPFTVVIQGNATPSALDRVQQIANDHQAELRKLKRMQRELLYYNIQE